ncbi:uncharacterized protein LOC111262827 [Varroa jacobsoni]|uniref:SHSP domain-containing protein n=1 Tax=Varroa destructor TaxID=109461 RepID=A0A7M7KMY5_VARDE|nr:uncharacterized protein LOC111253325 [Varroa destructor]XP_022693131.1 uncharacterized protein LOC111262827 [Varroa jacobsoni]
MGSNREIKVLSELSATSSSTAGSSGPHDPTFLGEKVHTSENKAERREYHSFDEFPTDARKYIDELLGPEAKTKFDNISVVSEETTRYSQPEVSVVNISHKKIVEENRKIPVVDERAMSSQQTTEQTSISSRDNTYKEETKTFTKDMLDQLPEECKKYINDFMNSQGMQNKNIEHVTVHTTRENTTSTGYTNDIPDLQVKNCLQSHDKIVVEIDASGFTAEDISMKVSGRNLVIQGKKEGPDPRDPATTLRKELKRDIVMPPGVDAAHVTCSLCANSGKLTVIIPFPQPVGGEYTIPIKTI